MILNGYRGFGYSLLDDGQQLTLSPDLIATSDGPSTSNTSADFNLPELKLDPDLYPSAGGSNPRATAASSSGGGFLSTVGGVAGGLFAAIFKPNSNTPYYPVQPSSSGLSVPVMLVGAGLLAAGVWAITRSKKRRFSGYRRRRNRR